MRILSLLLLLACACAHRRDLDDEDSRSSVDARLIGQPLAMAIGQFGPPLSNQNAGGVTVYNWEIEQPVSHPRIWERVARRHQTCRRWVTVDPNNIITQANHSEDCEE